MAKTTGTSPGGGVLKDTLTAASSMEDMDAHLKSILKTVNALGPAADKAASGLGRMSKNTPSGVGGGSGYSWNKALDSIQDKAGSLSGSQRVGLSLGLAAVGGVASMATSTSTGVGLQQSLFYGGFASGNVSTSALNANSMAAQNALGNFQSGIGGAQAAQSTLSQFGFGPNSTSGRSMLGQIGAMSLTTGKTNQEIAGTLGSQMTNPQQTNMLRMLGIETYGPGGQVKDVSSIAYQMLKKVFPNRKITPDLVQSALQPGGTLSLMVSSYFPDQNMQTLVRDAMMKTAMNGGSYTPNNAASMSRLGLSDTSSNPNAAAMAYTSSESRKANTLRNGQVAGYSAGLGAGAELNDAFTGVASSAQAVTDALTTMASAVESFNSTSGGSAIRNIAGVGLSALGGGRGGGSPDIGGGGNVPGSGAGGSAMTAWPTSSHHINTAYGVKGAWAAGHHTGIDLQAKDGDPVEAFEAGVVKGINTEGSAYGNHVLIDHGGGVTSLYAHLTSSSVKRGDKVTAGELIGRAGHTGNVHPAGSAGAHLHFEIRKNGGYGHDVNPLPYLNGAASVSNNAAPSNDPSGAATDASSPSTKSVGYSASSLSSPSGMNFWTDNQGMHATASTVGAGLGSAGGFALGRGSTNVAGGSATKGASNGSASGGTPSLTTDSNYLSTLIKAGWRGDALKTAWEVMMAESGGHATSHNTNSGTGDNSYGLFQINMLGSLGPDRRKRYGLSSNDALFDPATNAHVAYLMSGGGTNWSPWSTYKSGAYSKYAPAWDTLVKSSGLTGYSHGTMEVTHDQAANLHTGEIVFNAQVAQGVRESLAKGRAGQHGGPRQVTINVFPRDASEAAAQALAKRVKEIIEDDDMYAAIGGGPR